MVVTERRGGTAHVGLFNFEIGQEDMFKGTPLSVAILSLMYFSSSSLLLPF